MSSKLNFDATKVAPQQPLEPVPSGWYTVVIKSSEAKPSGEDKKGVRLGFELEIIEGEFKGRRIFDGLNIVNKNPVAQDIGNQQLSAICHATNTLKLTDSKELHDKPFQARVSLDAARRGEDGKDYDARNQCKAFKPCEGASAPVASPTNAPAWAKKNGSAPATPDKKTPPPGATPPPVAAEPDLREFWVVAEEGKDPVEATGDAIAEMLEAGMPTDTPVMLQTEKKWKVAADYSIGVVATPPPPAAKTPPPPVATPKAANRPPWVK